ncbi:hypothetical protein RUND412_006713 [Rhizina undulata]
MIGNHVALTSSPTGFNSQSPTTNSLRANSPTNSNFSLTAPLFRGSPSSSKPSPTSGTPSHPTENPNRRCDLVREQTPKNLALTQPLLLFSHRPLNPRERSPEPAPDIHLLALESINVKLRKAEIKPEVREEMIWNEETAWTKKSHIAVKRGGWGGTRPEVT